MMYTEIKIARKGFVNLLESAQWGQLILKRKKMKLLKNEQLESYENAKICYICKEKFEDNMQKIKMFQSRRSLP